MFVSQHYVVSKKRFQLGYNPQKAEGSNFWQISVPKYFQLMPYAICLDNRKASYAYKNVYFSVDANLNWDNPSELERQAIETLRNNPLVNSQAQAASAEHAENINKLMVSCFCELD
ncbi:unnamed protein product [Schistosoma margrebowiei]|uniref:Uncharacterized protein n=1 Tax=Schistosoma margrebowiei TaxID=48269 RepID=A0A183M9T3_9TREM|nr:unnamed protein product [Schistosoma margrebowiei]